MLAALLLNLPDYQKKNDADAGPLKRVRLPDGPVTRDDVIEAAKQLELASDVKPVAKKVRAYVEKEIVEQTDNSALLAELAMREYEYRQRMLQADQEQQIQLLLILEQISIVLQFVRDDEEAILALLLSE